MKIKNFISSARKKIGIPRIFIISFLLTILLVFVKYWLHQVGLEVIEQTSLHNAVLSSVVFVIGFLLSATIADYKESEKIPAEFAANIQDIYDDASAIHSKYPGFNLKALHSSLMGIAKSFRKETRNSKSNLKQDIAELHHIFMEMEESNVPPNFIVKLKQQQSQLLRNLFRVNYIQTISFIPSAFFLARSIIFMAIAILMLTNIDPFYGGLVITGAISFILIFMILLIGKISVPFHDSGATKDDVSLFLIRETVNYLNKNKPK